MTEAPKRPGDTGQGNKPTAPQDLPAAGPHGKEELIDRSKTPGAGMLTEPDAERVDGVSG